MPRVVFKQKGGAGKSVITCNLAAISASQGQRTPVIDLDSPATEDKPSVSRRRRTLMAGCASDRVCPPT
jgi:Mrp family chromosome partitioning ATPase